MKRTILGNTVIFWWMMTDWIDNCLFPHGRNQDQMPRLGNLGMGRFDVIPFGFIRRKTSLSYFLDLNMPIMTGEECLSNIRSERDIKKIPLILYSNYYDSFKMEVLKKKGAEHYFQKPNTFVVLKKYIGMSINTIETKSLWEFIIK